MKTKRLLSLTLAALMLLSLTAAAAAEEINGVKADGNSITDGSGNPIDNPVSGNVTVSIGTAVSAENGGQVIVNGDVTSSGASNSYGAKADGEGSKITIGSSDEGNNNRIVSGHTTGAYATQGGEVEVWGNATGTSGIAAKAEGESENTPSAVTIHGDASSEGNGIYGAYASSGGQVIVDGNSTCSGTRSKAAGAYADGTGSSVTVGKDASGRDAGAKANDGGTVEVGGNAQSGYYNDNNEFVPAYGYGAYAYENGTVTVAGNATGKLGGAFASSNSTVIVGGDASSSDTAAKALGANSITIIGGNATGGGGINAASGGTVIVEGTVTGSVESNKGDEKYEGTAYAGALAEDVDSVTGNGTGASSQATNLTGFLVGLKEQVITNLFSKNKDDEGLLMKDADNALVIGDSENSPDNLKQTASGKKYYVADPTKEEIVLTLNQSQVDGKTVSGLSNGKDTFNVSNNTVTISYNSLGGMNALVLIFKDAPQPSGGSGSSGSSGSSGGESRVIIMPHTFEPRRDNKGMVLKCNAKGAFDNVELEGLLKVLVDFSVIDEANYKVFLNEDGNIDIIFEEEYLASLSGGVHMVSVIISNFTYTSQINIPFVR